MKSLLHKSVGAVTSLLMLLTIFLVPQSSLAKMPGMSNHHGPNDQGGGEGDPLDSNDYSTGGGDDEVHSRRVVPSGHGKNIISRLDSGGMLIFRVDFVGDIPVFTIQVISAQELRLEENHVR